MNKRKVLCGMLLLLLSLPCLVWADGFIIIPDPPPQWKLPKPPQLSIKYHDVTVSIKGGVVRTEVDQVFINHYDMDLEGTYIFPLPEGAAVDEFAMYVDGERIVGEVMDADEARKKYEDYVRQMKDPALLEYVGRNAFKASIYPIPANGEKRVQLAYSEVLSPDAGLYLYRYPLDTERFSREPIERVEVNITLESDLPILNVYSPSHNISVEREDNYRVTVHYEEKNTQPDKDLILYYQLDDEGVGVSLITDKESGEDGSFILMITPQYYQEAVESALPKDMVFVYDRSGSMSGEKIEQAREAIIFCLENLNPQDNFNVIAFASDVRSWQDELVPASKANIQSAIDFVKDIPARGGTDIHSSLLQALSELDKGSSNPQMVIFLTDGEPTVGVTDNVEIVDAVKSANDARARVFIFGVGYDVNAVLLDHMAKELYGISQYVIPDENLEIAVSSFYSKVSMPVLSDIRLDFGSISIYDVQPIHMPDLFRGSQLMVTGRYKGSGYSTLTLSGDVAGREEILEYSLNFKKDKNPFVPVIWARRHIGYLLEEIRIHGENEELAGEIKRLALKYGIVTPYTSYYIGEVTKTTDIDRLVYGVDEAARFKIDTLGGLGGGDLMKMAPEALSEAPVGGGGGVTISQDIGALKKGTEEYASKVVKVVEGRAFYLIDGMWTDGDYKEEMTVKEIEFGSDEYMRLLIDHPGIGKYLCLGSNLIVMVDRVVYKIVDSTIQ